MFLNFNDKTFPSASLSRCVFIIAEVSFLAEVQIYLLFLRVAAPVGGVGGREMQKVLSRLLFVVFDAGRSEGNY